jgi:hypothetical protein
MLNGAHLELALFMSTSRRPTKLKKKNFEMNVVWNIETALSISISTSQSV